MTSAVLIALVGLIWAGYAIAQIGLWRVTIYE